MTVAGLDPNTCYTANVAAVNAIGTGNASSPSHQFVTLEEGELWD